MRDDDPVAAPDHALRLACLLTGASAAMLALDDGESLRTVGQFGEVTGGIDDALWRELAAGDVPQWRKLEARSDGLRAFAAVPLRDDRQCLGLLCVFDMRVDAFSDATLERLAPLAALLSAQIGELTAARKHSHRAERAAAFGARRFEDLADSLPVFVWTATPEGTVDYFGRPLIEYSGVSAKALEVPGAWLELLHPDDRAPVVEIWSASVSTGQPYSVNFRIRRRDGVYRWFSVSALALRDEQGAITIWYGCAADIDDAMRLQHETHELAARLSATFASIQEAFFTLDGEGRVTALNDAARRQLADGRDVGGLPAWEAFPELGATGLPDECRSVIEHGHALRFELFLAASQCWHEAEIFPAEAGLTVLLRNIDRRVRDEMLRTAEARALGMMAADAELSEVLECIVHGVEAAVPGAMASILLFDARAGVLRHGAAPSLPDAYNRLVDGLAPGPRNGSCGTAAWLREPVIAADIVTDERWAGYRDIARGFDLRACWSTPVMGAGGEVLATFAIYFRQVCTPNASDEETTGRAAKLVAVALRRDQEQRALRASEEQFRSVFRDAATGMVITSIDGRFLDANEAYCKMVGYGVDELRKRDVLSITHPDDRARNRKLLEQLVCGELPGFVIEKRYITRGERVVWVRLSVSMQRDASGRPARLVAVTEDVTVRRLAEETLVQQSALLAMASRLGQLGAWMVEVPAGRLIWSDEVRNMLEAPVEHVPDLQQDVATLYTPESAVAVAQAVRECMECGTAIDMAADIHTLSGRLLHVHILGEAVRDETGNIVRVQGTLQNITEQHRLMRSLADSEARFRELAESVQDVFWVRGLRLDSLLYVSPAYERVWGRSCAELYAHPQGWFDSILPDDRPILEELFAQDQSQPYEIEYRIQLPDGEVRWIVDRGFPVFGETGEVVRVTGVARDITDRKHAEQKLRDALDQLARSNRELEGFAYVASHDLQEPLRKIKLFSDRLVDGSHALGEQERDYLDRMARAAARMQTLIHDLLDYSRVSTHARPMRRVSLDEAVDEAMADLDVTVAECGARIERGPLPHVLGDPAQLRQLAFNLIGNALKFRRPGVSPVVRVFGDCRAGRPCLCVADNGIGIDPAQAERIFLPFQRLHGRNEYPGSGIGLAIVKKIADRHCARIEVDGQPGEGSCFRVLFDAAPASD